MDQILSPFVNTAASLFNGGEYIESSLEPSFVKWYVHTCSARLWSGHSPLLSFFLFLTIRVVIEGRSFKALLIDN